MATLVTKNSSTASAIPGTGDLVQGELAVNVTDKRLFTKNAGGSVVEVGTNPSSLIVTGDVGIGTSSPGAKLQVAGTFRQNDATSTYGYTVTTASSKTVTAALFGGGYFAWQTNASGTDQLTLDSSGNLGLGVTPSAWAGDKALQVNWGSISSGYEYSVNVSSVAYRDNTTWKYLASSQAPARYEQIGGAHKWFTAATGTAGNAISFTQVMSLDASGNLGVGTSSPAQRLDVVTTSATVAKFTRDLATDVSLTIGADTDGAILGTDGVNVMRMFTGGTERARITSGGDLLVGTTTVSGAGGLTYLNQGSTGFASINNNNAAATGYVFQSFRRSSTEIGSVTQNGTTAVLFNTTSDRRLKDNIVPAPSASAVIDAIEIVSHDWKAAPDEHVTYGVIAQDLALVAPQAVLQGDDGDEIEKTWGVDYSKLVPMLIKEIQSLRARVAALESV